MKRVFTKLAFRDFSLACNACSALATKGVGKVLMLLMLIGLCSSSALAKTISIGTEQTYTTLSAANGNLNDGDILILTSDVNVGGNITWTKNITIQGNGNAIKSAGNNQRITIQSTVSLDGVVLDGDGKNPSQYFITISGTSSKLIMDASSKITNVAGYPAVYLNGGSLTGGQITGCTNTNNNDGIVYVSSASSVLSNCRITGNTIRNKDGACVVYLKGRMVNCVVAENEKESGIYNPQAVAAYDLSYVINCTIVSNSNLYGYFRISGTSYLYNSIIWGNSNDIYWNGPYYSNCVTTNPNLSSDYSLTANSTDCINRGNNTCFTANSTLSTDIVGNPRFTGTIDVGAYELGANIYYAKLTAKYGNTDCTNKMGTLTSTPAIPSWSQDANHLYSFAISSGSSSTQDVTVNVENASFDVTTGTVGNRVTTTYVFDHWETSEGTVVSGNTLTFTQDKTKSYVAIYKTKSYFWMNAMTDEGVEIPRANYVSDPVLKYENTQETSGIKNGFTVSKFSTTFTAAELATDMPDITYEGTIYEFDHWESMSNGSQVCTRQNNNWNYGDATWTTGSVQNPVLTTTNSNTSFWGNPTGNRNPHRTANYTYYTAVYKVKGTTYYATLTAKGNDGTALTFTLESSTPTISKGTQDSYSFTKTPKQDNIQTENADVTPQEQVRNNDISYYFDHWELNESPVGSSSLVFNKDEAHANTYVAIYKSGRFYATLTAKGNDGEDLSAVFAGNGISRNQNLYYFDSTSPTGENMTASVTTGSQTITKKVNGEQVTYTFDHWELPNHTRVDNPLTFNVNKTAVSYVAIYKSSHCAVISASKTTDLVWGENVRLKMDQCDYTDYFVIHWQGSNDKNDKNSWTDIDGQNQASYNLTYSKNSYKYYRIRITHMGSDCYSNILTLSKADCSIFIEVVDALGNPLTQQFTESPTLNSYVAEGETQYSIRLKTINNEKGGTITALHQRIPTADGTSENDNRKWTWPDASNNKVSEVRNNTFTVPSADVTYEYEIKYTDCAGKAQTEHCIVRVEFSCKSKDSDVIWNDDFGWFNGRTYTYVSDNGVSKSIQADANGTKYAVKDQNGAVVNHEYFLNRDAQDWDAQDGYYAIVKLGSDASNNFNQDKYYDHTSGDGTGGMLVVNFANEIGSVFYQRDIPARDCDGALVYLSCYIAGVQGGTNNNTGNYSDPTNWSASTRLHEPNVKMEVWSLTAGGTEDALKASFYSGDVPNPNHGKDEWVNLSAYFKMEKNVRYRMKLINNKKQRYGNDVRFDDISAVACYPSLQITDDPKVVDESKTGVVICGTESDTITLYASVGGDIKKYYDHPYYRYQYRKDANSPWVDFNGQNHDVDSCRIAMLDVDPGVQMRAIVAKDSAMVDWVCKSYTDSAKKYTDPADEAKRYPKVNCAHPYGYSFGFTIDYFPALEKMEAGKTQYECIGKDHILKANIPAQYTNIQWYNVENDVPTAITGANQSSLQFTMDKSYKEHWLIVKNEQNACPDTVRYVTEQNTSVSLECLDKSIVKADDECQMLYRLRPEASSCVPDAVYSYSYKLNETDAYTPWDTTAGILLPLGENTIYWKVLMTSENYGIVESLNISDTCSQIVLVTDSTAPVLASISDSLLDFSLNGCVYKIPDLSTVALSAATDNCTDKTHLTFVEQSVLAGTEYTQTDAQQTIPVVVKVKDEAGNIGEQTVNVIIPANDFSFVCANYAFLSEDGQIEFDCPAVTPAESVVEWSTNNTALSTTGGKISGTLPFGNTTVTISAKKCDKKVDCSTTITVIKRADACGHDE
ncbi:MAG: hypothetical protein MJZ34_14900 [Paludibacteraceae bacterium]|nr:hypothetical protein [Paludibacteraceae bacterium]